MPENIAVDFDVLTAHAARVEQVASAVGLGAQAASSLNLGGGAFGLMCAFMVPPIELVSTMAQRAIASAQQMVSRSAVGVRGMRDDFMAFEEAASDEFSALTTEVEGSPR
jgi:hypothetical protein